MDNLKMLELTVFPKNKVLKSDDENRPLFLKVDLEAMSELNFEEAFSIVRHDRDNNFTYFSEYNGLVKSAELPNNLDRDVLLNYLNSLIERNTELTQGFEINKVNGNEVGRFYDLDGDLVTEYTNWDNGIGWGFWEKAFQHEVSNLS